MTSFYDRHILPRLIGCACGAGAIAKQRARVVPQAEGRVLELGIGGGLNLPFYDPARVASVTGVDPSEGLRDRALAAPRPEGLKVEVLAGEAEHLDFADQSFDTVVCTFTLCSVHTPEAVLAEARRVLKPEGRFLFCEHGLAPDPKVAAWQKRIEPFWTPLAGGCHLTRPVGASIASAGFTIDAHQAFYMPKAPRPLGWCELGAARIA
ncbi:MAG: SAM-dependent methyltransferase [Caulobacter sp. 32-67-35]|nr:MAG: SAM-dependent methyltransferase [Caulobacter sp. 32-67-35]